MAKTSAASCCYSLRPDPRWPKLSQSNSKPLKGAPAQPTSTGTHWKPTERWITKTQRKSRKSSCKTNLTSHR